MAAFHEQEQSTALSEQEPQGQRPIDRLRQLLTEAQTDHLEFLTPNSKKILLCTDRYFESRHSALELPKEHEVVVVFGDPRDSMCYPDYEFDEQFWFMRDSVEIMSGHARTVVDSPFLGHIERIEEDEFSLLNETGNWQGEEYDRLASRALEIIQQSTPFAPPAQ